MIKSIRTFNCKNQLLDTNSIIPTRKSISNMNKYRLSEPQLKHISKKIIRKGLNLKQQELKLLLTELISRMNQNRHVSKIGINADKNDIASK
ncbi:MAG: hypothetical protein IPL53_23950 [Ignavibacteria bacterium]|nr:hypothetical protein [Ignavibacteria bacterium]